jgi:hypothetical protein
MADKSIAQLNEAEKVYSDNLFVLHQAGEAKKLSGSTLKNWLLEIANSLGGISKIEKVNTSGLKDTYRIYYAKDGTTTDFTVTNGEKGDKGDNSYIWIRYTGQKPTESSHSFGTDPDDWMGIYAGNSATAPTDYKDYSWFKIKGEKGDTGDAATVMSKSVTYQVGSSGTTAPSGPWIQDVPTVPQGQFLWTKTDVTFNTGDTITWYSVSRMGIDGTGAVSTVCGVDPDSGGNVALTGTDIPISKDNPTTYVTTAISGKQAKITVSGLLKGNGSGGVSAAVAGTDYQSPVKSATVTLSANAWSGNSQTINVSNVTAGSLVTVAPVPTALNRTAYLEAGVYCSAQGVGTLTFVCEDVPSVNLNVNVQIINP